MNYREIAARYGVSIRTAHRYVSQNAPVEDESKMRDWLDEHHSRRGVGKFSHRRDATPVTPTTPVAAPVRAGINVDADIIPAVIETIKPQSAAPEETKAAHSNDWKSPSAQHTSIILLRGAANEQRKCGY
jgi:hypothetical protein